MPEPLCFFVLNNIVIRPNLQRFEFKIHHVWAFNKKKPKAYILNMSYLFRAHMFRNNNPFSTGNNLNTCKRIS